MIEPRAPFESIISCYLQNSSHRLNSLPAHPSPPHCSPPTHLPSSPLYLSPPSLSAASYAPSPHSDRSSKAARDCKSSHGRQRLQLCKPNDTNASMESDSQHTLRNTALGSYSDRHNQVSRNPMRKIIIPVKVQPAQARAQARRWRTALDPIPPQTRGRGG